MGQLRIGVGDPRHGMVLDLGRQPEQRVLDHHAGVMRRHVGELRAARDVADRVHPLVAGAQARVDLDARCAVLDAAGLEIEAVDVGAPARGHQHVAAGDAPFDAVVLERKGDAVAVPSDGSDFGPLAQVDAFGAQPIAHHRDRVGIVLGQDREQLEDGHPRAQAPICLSQLAADRAAADHDQVLRPLGQVEHRLVGQVRHFGETRDRRHGGGRAGRDHDPARPNAPPVRLDFLRPDEAGMGADDLDAELLEALLRVVRRDRRDHPFDVVVHAEEVDRGLVAVDAEAPGGANGVRGAARRDQRLGRHAAVVQAVAAHLALLDQHDLGAHLHRAGGNREPARARADHAQIGPYRFSHAILP